MITNLVHGLEGVAGIIVKASLEAAALAVLILIIQRVLRNKLSPGWRFGLWYLLLIKLAVPVLPESPTSLFNLTTPVAQMIRKDPMSEPAAFIEPVSRVRSPIALASPSGPSKKEDRDTKDNALTQNYAKTGVTSSPTSDSHVELTWFSYVGFTWLSGFLLLGGWYARASFRFNRSLRAARPVSDPALLEVFRECANRFGFRRAPELVETDAVRSPAVYGLFRPKVLLPTEMIYEFTAIELRHVFFHELSHIRRRDLSVQWLMCLLQAIHWFNPAIWFAFRRVCADREIATDASALSVSDEREKRPYGETILKLLQSLARPVGIPGAVGIAEDRSLLRQRIQSIAAFRKVPRWSLLAAAVFAALGLGTLTEAQISKRPDDSASQLSTRRTNHSQFELRLVADKPADGIESLPLLVDSSDNSNPKQQTVLTRKEPLFDGAAITGAFMETNRFDDRPEISIELTENGRRKFAEISSRHIGEKLAIVVDGQVISAPVIRDPITSGRIVISGNFSKDKASRLVSLLSHGEARAPRANNPTRDETQGRAEYTPTPDLPDPRALLKAVATARQNLASGEIHYDVYTSSPSRKRDGTNHLSLKILFNDGNRRAEQVDREYSYVLMGPDAAKVTDAKMEELGLDREAAVRAGLLKGFESRYVTVYDGSSLMTYWSANNDTQINDLHNGSSTYIFDPRVLGLRPSPYVSDTPAKVLVHDNADSIRLLSNESIEGIETWHVRATYNRSDPKIGSYQMNYDFWIDTHQPLHVVKSIFNGNSAISKYDDTHPKDPLPVEVREVHFYGLERTREDQTFVRRAAHYDYSVDPSTFELAGLDMPIGTEVIDARISRGIGYWDGKGLSENRPKNSNPIRNQDQPSDPAKMLAMATKDPKSDFAREAAAWVMLNTPDGPEVQAAADIILNNHVLSTNLVPLCDGLDRLRHRSAIPLLRAITEKNPNEKVRAHAQFTLAMILKTQANLTGDHQDVAEADKLFEQIIDEHSKDLGEDVAKLAERAQSELFESQRLGVGQPAPEIAGPDLNGQPMKLSDYRGKVVVLNFWGVWCSSCMAMVPDERNLVARMNGKPFVLIGVNSDEETSVIQKALKRERITWPSFRDGANGPIAKAWNVHSWPTTYVLDRDGVIRYRDVQGDTLEAAVDSLLAEE